MKQDLLRIRREKERAQSAAQQAAQVAAKAADNQKHHTLTKAHGITAQHHTSAAVSSSHKRKREEEKETPMPSKSKKKKMISTTSTKESKKDIKLYCICKTPYDETKYDQSHESLFSFLIISVNAEMSSKELHPVAIRLIE